MPVSDDLSVDFASGYHFVFVAAGCVANISSPPGVTELFKEILDIIPTAQSCRPDCVILSQDRHELRPS